MTEAFDYDILQGNKPPIPASQATFTPAQVSALPHLGAHACAAIGMLPTDYRSQDDYTQRQPDRPAAGRLQPPPDPVARHAERRQLDALTNRLAPLAAILLAACAAPAATATDAPIPSGSGQQTAVLDAVPIQVFTYRPSACTLTGILLVFHGLDRNAGPYRDDAVPLGQRYCMLVVAPLFDTDRFPTWRYQRGGIVHGPVQPHASWTVNFVPRLAEWARAREADPGLPYALIGHSAGGQFLSRVAAFSSATATRIVIANPSTWVEPSLDVAAPYGFAGVYPPAQGEAALRRYLALPITVLLGGNDTGSANLAGGRSGRGARRDPPRARPECVPTPQS